MRLLTNIFVLIASLVFVLGGAELLCQFNVKPQTMSIFEYDEDKLYTLKKHYRGYLFGKAYATNSFAHRDTEIPIVKDENTIRVLCIGDSVTFGFGVDAQETFPQQLELMLNQEDLGYRFDVINAAVPGNSPFQEYYDLKRGLMLNPDIIIVQFVLNDLIEPYHILTRLGGEGIDYHNVRDFPSNLKVLARVHHFLNNHSAFYYSLHKIITSCQLRIVNTQAKESGGSHSLSWVAGAYEPNSLKVKEAWKECLHWMQEIIRMSQDRKMEVILLVSPHRTQLLRPEATYAQQVLKEFALHNDIRYLDILPKIEAKVKQRVSARLESGLYSRAEVQPIWNEYYLDDFHLTLEGHRLYAQALFPFIKDIAQQVTAQATENSQH